jgi:glycosyltransferase involved in cell wall biosynthesis
VIAISHAQACDAETAGIPIQAVVHHGLPTRDYPPGSGAGGYAAFVGRMSPNKGVDVACRVARRAGTPLVIAARLAEPAEHAYFEAVIRPLLGDGVSYVGEVNHANKLALLGDAACLLNPVQWNEPFGLAMIEALACGTPVVATPFGSVPEIVDDGITGYIRADAEALVDALTTIGQLDRSDCRQAVETRFEAARMATRHVSLYQEIAYRWPASPRPVARAARTAGRSVGQPVFSDSANHSTGSAASTRAMP